MQEPKPRLLFATRNPNKSEQIQLLLREQFEVTDLRGRDDIPEVEETGDTFEENARLKAVEASRHVPHYYVLADDSGLCVEALGGRPGVRSARFAGDDATDDENNRLLLEQLHAQGFVDPMDRKAHYTCCMVIARNGQALKSVFGEVHGTIISRPSGDGGFGYDPLFLPDQGGPEDPRTFAEMSNEEKLRFNHRGIALRKAAEFLRDQIANEGHRDPSSER
jgi:XTP/dITP diphosphohydrolase